MVVLAPLFAFDRPLTHMSENPLRQRLEPGVTLYRPVSIDERRS